MPVKGRGKKASCFPAEGKKEGRMEGRGGVFKTGEARGDRSDSEAERTWVRDAVTSRGGGEGNAPRAWCTPPCSGGGRRGPGGRRQRF